MAKEYSEYGYPEPTHQRALGLHLILGQGLSGPEATKAIGKILAHISNLLWLDPPVPNGHITVLDVARARNLAEHRRFVEDWAGDVKKYFQ